MLSQPPGIAFYLYGHRMVQQSARLRKKGVKKKRGQVHFHVKMDLTPFFDPFFPAD